MSQTTEEEMTLYEAAVRAQRELRLDLSGLDKMDRLAYLQETQWKAVLERKKKLEEALVM